MSSVVLLIALVAGIVTGGYHPGGYLSGSSHAFHMTRVCKIVAAPHSRFTIVCHWVRS